MSSASRLDKAYKNAKRITFNDTSKFILFSDCHRGDNSFADDFANNRNIYFHALKHYYNKGCLLYTSPSPRDGLLSRMPSSA